MNFLVLASLVYACSIICCIAQHNKICERNRERHLKSGHFTMHSFSFLSCISSLCKKNTIHQVTTILATSENVLFSGLNHLLTTSVDDPTL